jgi:hypothetical protein
MNGAVTGVSWLPVVQLVGELRQTGTLRLTQGAATGSLAFDSGRLVAAECGHQHGLQAVAQCALDLTGAQYAFEKGTPKAERTLDLGPADVTKLLTRVTSDNFVSTNGTVDPDPTQPPACPLLGFADDRDHHYSRSTAMHRCYVGGAASLVSAQDQRDLCLSGRFGACPRFRNAGATAPLDTVATAPAPAASLAPEAQPVPAPAASVAPAAQPVPVPPPPLPAPSVPLEVQPDVAAATAGASEMHPAATPHAEPQDAAPAARQLTPAPIVPVSPERRRRSPVLIASTVAACLALLMLIAPLAVPGLRGEPAPPAVVPTTPPTNPTPATVDAAAAVEPDPTSTPVRRAIAAPLSGVAAPTLALASTPADGSSLMDVRFASGAAARWLDNQPYAGWSDGAYRLLARDATRFVAVGVPLTRDVSDVVVSATFRKTGGPPGGGYGLIVRDQGPEPRDGVNQEFNAYVLETGDLGEYGVWRRDGDHWVDLVPWTPSSAVRPGGSPNDLLVRAVGDQLSFSVNGSVIAVVTDDTFPEGGVGVFAGGDDNAVALDRLNLELPD